MPSSIKFSTKSELEIFKALQKEGRLSNKKLAKKTGFKTSTIQHARERLEKKEFYNIKAVSNLNSFPELPIAIVGLHHLDPKKIKKLKEDYLEKDEIRAFISDNEKIFLILMASSKDKLAELILEIVEKSQGKPILYMLSPNIGKLDLSIPDPILDSMYSDLKDRTRKS